METKKIFWLLTGGIGVAWGAAYGFAKWNERAFHSMSDRGTFGDSFGAFNAVVGGLGFAAVAYSLYRQQKQISQETADRMAQDDKEDQARKEQDRKVDRQLEVMRDQATAMTKLAEAMAADAERSRLMLEYEIIDKRITIRYNEVPKRYSSSDPPYLLQRLSYVELEGRRDAVKVEALKLRMANMSIQAEECDRFAFLLKELLALREKRKKLYLKLTGQDYEES